MKTEIKILLWAGILTPPGIWAQRSGGMSKAGNQYFDWYLDGKREVQAPARKQQEATRKGPFDTQIFKQRDTNGNGVWEKTEIGK